MLAEEYARRAVSLTEAQRNKDVHKYESTLGEVLLSSGRSFEAIEVLESAESSAAAHATDNEIRWDLARAYICAAQLANSNERKQELLKRANHYHAVIRRSEMRREYRPFTNEPALLDPAIPPPSCLRVDTNSVEGLSLGDNAPFVLAGGAPASEAEPVPDWIGVSWNMEGHRALQETEDIVLHVWGGGHNATVPLTSDSGGGKLQLSTRMRDSRYYYFAQLRYSAETEDGESVDRRLSDVVPLQTFGGEDRNLIVLNFVCDKRFDNEYCDL